MKSGRGTFPRSLTSGAYGHTVYYRYFRGWLADKNGCCLFWTVSISTSGVNLWGFEFFSQW